MSKRKSKHQGFVEKVDLEEIFSPSYIQGKAGDCMILSRIRYLTLIKCDCSV